jgi:hypothetical protein
MPLGGLIMSTTLYSRKNKTVNTLATGATEVFKSINKAKKQSVKLQEAQGGLGRGSLVVLS